MDILVCNGQFTLRAFLDSHLEPGRSRKVGCCRGYGLNDTIDFGMLYL